MISHLLDTDVCIHILKKRSHSLLDSLKRHDGRLAVCDVTLFELYYSAERYAEPDFRKTIIEDFTSRIELLPFDSQSARHAGNIHNVLEKKGQMIGSYDVMIAAVARSRGLTLATGNLREFKRVDGLLVEKWN